ncbi:hypothetical protein [Halosimplex marinum]|uniref:hypothetical protein n=1 Tax=Halosimplex marinum TaxID=3396620 RepID=UPI003F55B5D8
MCASLQRQPSAGWPIAAEYAALAAVLAGLVVVRVGVGYGTGALRSVTGILRVPLVVTVAYSAVALAALGAGFVALTAGRGGRLDGDELVQAGLAAAALVVVAVYLAIGRPAVGVSAEPVVRSAGYSVAVGLLAVGYARVADLEVPTAPPTRDGWLATGLAVVAVAVVVALATVGATAAGWLDGPFAAFRYGAAPSALSFVLGTVVPATITAVGTALLFNGAVQAAFRRHRSPAAAVGAVTLLAFGADWVGAAVPAALSPALGPVPASVRWLVVLAAMVLAVVAVLAAAVACGRLWDERDALSDSGRPALAAAGAGAAVGAVVAVVGYAFVGLSPGPAAVSYAVAVGAAALASERARTVWAPAAVYAAHGVAIQLAPYYALSGGPGNGAATVLLTLA